jgi:flagellar biosynthesis protein FliR
VIQTWIVAYTLILARVGTLVATFPLFGGQYVPKFVKVGFSVSLAALWFTVYGLTPTTELLGASTDLDWLKFGLAIGREILLGVMLGYAFNLFLVPVHVAGEFIGQELGLALGGQFDPANFKSSSVITQVFEMLGILLFLGLNCHHIFLAVLHSSFVRWPIGVGAGQMPFRALVDGAAASQEWGILVAAPLVLVLFLTTVGLALLARAVPQMNLFSVGFALRIIIGLSAMFVLLPDLIADITKAFGQVCDFVLRLA